MKKLVVLLSVLVLASCIPAGTPQNETEPSVNVSVSSATSQRGFRTFYIGLVFSNGQGGRASQLEYTVVAEDADGWAITSSIDAASTLPISIEAGGADWALIKGNSDEVAYGYALMVTWVGDSGKGYSWAKVGNFTLEP